MASSENAKYREAYGQIRQFLKSPIYFSSSAVKNQLKPYPEKPCVVGTHTAPSEIFSDTRIFLGDMNELGWAIQKTPVIAISNSRPRANMVIMQNYEQHEEAVINAKVGLYTRDSDTSTALYVEQIVTPQGITNEVTVGLTGEGENRVLDLIRKHSVLPDYDAEKHGYWYLKWNNKTRSFDAVLGDGAHLWHAVYPLDLAEVQGLELDNVPLSVDMDDYTVAVTAGIGNDKVTVKLPGDIPGNTSEKLLSGHPMIPVRYTIGDRDPVTLK